MKRTLLTFLMLTAVSTNPVFALGESESEEAGIKRVVALTNAQSYAKATDLFERLIEADPNNPQLRLAGARLYRRMGLFARAMSEYKLLMRADPNLLEPMIALSQMYMEYLNLPQALTLARRAVSLKPNDKAAHIALCTVLIASDYLKEAEDELGKLQKQAGSDADVNYVGYKLYLRHGQIGKARQQLEAAMKLDPSNGQWLLDLSELCEMQGDYATANQCLQRALYADPLSIDKLSRMATLQEYFLQNYDQATLQYKRILAIDPDSVTALAGLDRCKTRKNDLAGMLKIQIRALAARLMKMLA
ncbi:MAG: tetratricopeptide repeat protein [Candidatus Melainabacteria bacterium]|nr:tetratricopeptide repeat protein [Candidatus Melainabacteria bacterium]